MREPFAAMEFVDVAAESDLPEDRGLRVVVDGTPVALFRDGASVVALVDRCPHAGAPLSSGACRDGVVTCAWHGFTFDAKTGACGLWAGAPSATVRAAKVENGRVLVARV